MSIADRAKEFAIKAHADQKYGDSLPYQKHLKDVVNCLEEFNFWQPDIQAVGWLHDVVEDTLITIADIRENFNPYISQLVYAVTNEQGKNRKERHEKTYPKIKAVGKYAIAVKLADRISNVRHSLKTNHDMFYMYKKEYPLFKENLYFQDDTLDDMWKIMDELMENYGVEMKKVDNKV
jgi:(p)ppGpp synthase/HD superfamily hydrolase